MGSFFISNRLLPFVFAEDGKFGLLFLKTDVIYQPGDELFLFIELEGDPEKIPIIATVKDVFDGNGFVKGVSVKLESNVATERIRERLSQQA